MLPISCTHSVLAKAYTHPALCFTYLYTHSDQLHHVPGVVYYLGCGILLLLILLLRRTPALPSTRRQGSRRTVLNRYGASSLTTSTKKIERPRPTGLISYWEDYPTLLGTKIFFPKNVGSVLKRLRFAVAPIAPNFHLIYAFIHLIVRRLVVSLYGSAVEVPCHAEPSCGSSSHGPLYVPTSHVEGLVPPVASVHGAAIGVPYHARPACGFPLHRSLSSPREKHTHRGFVAQCPYLPLRGAILCLAYAIRRLLRKHTRLP